MNHEFALSPDRTTFIYRIDPDAARLLKVATSVEDEASKRLNEAWNTAFAFDGSRPGAAWGAAIAAMEASLAPIVTPGDAKATLGKITPAIFNKPGKFASLLPTRPSRLKEGKDLSGAELIAQMAHTIGYQPGRHGGDNQPEPDEATARAVVALATSVVALVRLEALKTLED